MKKSRLTQTFITFLISLSIFLSNSLLPGNIAYANLSGNIKLPNSTDELIKNLDKYNKGNIKVKTNFNKNGAFFISGTLSDEKTPNDKEALTFLDQNKAALGVDKVLGNFKQIASAKDDLGYTHIKLNQYIQGLPVKNKQATVHFDKDGKIASVNGNLCNITTLTRLGDKSIDESEAIKIAQNQFNITQNSSSNSSKDEYQFSKLNSEPTAKKMAVIIGNNAYEVYLVNIKYTSPDIENWAVYVETSSGKVIDKQSNLRFEDPASTTGVGYGTNGKSKNLNLASYAGNYYMADLTKPMSNDIETYSAYNTNGSYWGIVYNNTNVFNTENFKSSVDAHYNAGVVYDFYKNLFNRNSIDNNGMGIYSLVHYASNYNNAFWDGNEMVYGDGDGSRFTYLSGDLDIVGHEMTHGVTESKASLEYNGQSGALDESISDVFGVLIETYDKYNVKNGGTWQFNAADWVIGDDVYTPYIPGDALRSLANPTLYNQPDNMDNLVITSSDNGGVHTNSGIPNKAAYLIAQSIGMAKTANIYYRAYDYLNPTIDFKGAAYAIIQAASDLYGANSSEVNAVNVAFSTVKILPIVNVVSVNLNKTIDNLNVGNTDTLIATLNPANATNNNVIWTSNNPSVATVDANGKITGISAGNAAVTVTTADGNKTATCSITVSQSTVPVESVSLNKSTDTLTVGQTDTLAATINPSNATNKNVTWTSSNTSIATVDANGKVTGVAAGNAVVTVTTTDGNKVAACSFTIKTNHPPIISGAADKTVKVGDSIDLKAGITATDAEDGDLTSKISITGNVDTTKIGNYPVTCSVTDSDGNTTIVTIQAIVVSRSIQTISIIGTDRYDTAARLSQSQFTTADTVLLVNGEASADGLGATPLAAFKKSPILLTDTNILPDSTKNEILRLKAKNAIIVGGTGVVSYSIVQQLNALGINQIDRLGGASRYETSLLVAQYIDKNCYTVGKVAISYGYGEPDALSVASAAARNRMPIILVDKNEVPPDTFSWLTVKKLQDAYIIGGSGVVSDTVFSKIAGITSGNISSNRLGGKDRYETNALIIDRFYGNVIDKTYIAKGELLVDALAAGPVAATNVSPVVISDTDLSDAQKAVLGKRYGNTIMRTGGGISDASVNSLKTCLQ